ncbi:15207_t:CDS:1, partial [Gigaspora rosea]
MSSLLNEAMLNNNEPGILLLIDIDAIFDIDEESDMDISDNEIDDALDRIMDATDGVEE